jgi:hypothetical protein
MSTDSRVIGLSALLVACALSAQAGTALFQASFIVHAWGNDITSGTRYPYNEDVFNAVPLGHDCRSTVPYGPNGTRNPHYCSDTIFEVGVPATGSGPLLTTESIALSQSAFGITTTGLLLSYYPYLLTYTHATFANAKGTFFAGGGPAAAGTVTKTGMGQTSGAWTIRPGENAFGGVLGMLGRYGGTHVYMVTGKPGTYEGTGSWAIVPPMGREQYAEPIEYTAMGKAIRWQNPFQVTNTYINDLNGNTSTLQARGTGSPWTTGTVTVLAKAGVFQTILKRSGFDTTSMVLTPMGGSSTVRNIQLVTPTLTHWIGPGYQTHTGQIGILELTLTPEPAALLALAAGLGVLLALRLWSRRR